MAFESLTNIAAEFSIPIWLLVIILIWTLYWKLLAMWKAAKKSSPIWFVVLALLNTVGILPILYIYLFSKIGERKITPMKKIKAKPKKKVGKKKK